MSLLKDVKNPDKKYRPVPFWSWNEKLNSEETLRQIDLMDKAGIGGFFMHARGGLQTEYVGDEWFEQIKVSVDEAKKRGMHAWAYDENGWPSGFANNAVNGMGLYYQQKHLRVEKGEKQTDCTICNADGYHFYYEVNEFYVDNLNKKVVAEFIEKAYEPYYKKFGTEFEGYFTDEPQLSRNGYPWSFILPEEYEKEYGESLLPLLPGLFFETGDFENTRLKYWRLVTKLFCESYVKQIYEWCDERGLKFTGHMVLEETFRAQTMANGAVMPHHRYFHIPAVDFLGRNLRPDMAWAALQVGSVAQQMGRKQVLTESFALCGHAVNFNELRRIYEWQMVRGVNLLCQHLEGYSLRGIRKRDYPPALGYQQPWWDEYKDFNDSMSRIGMLLAEGTPKADTLVIHTVSSGWVSYNGRTDCEKVEEYEKEFVKVVNEMERKQILFHLGDETIMEEMAYVENGELVIGKQRYKTVVLPPHRVLFDSTKKLLSEFEASGGKVVSVDEVEPNRVSNNENLTYTRREFDGFTMHYFVNSTDKKQPCEIYVGNAVLDILSGDVKSFDGKCVVEPMSSIVVLDVDEKEIETKCEAAELKNLSVDGEWEIKSCTDNALLLEYCDCYFDGELAEKNMHINDVANRANDLERKVDVRLVFKANFKTVPEKIDLACETPEIFEFIVNGKPYKFSDKGFFTDHSFRRSDISSYLKTGENVIEVLCHDFVQSDETYKNIAASKIFESQKNKLSFDMEIEAMYLVGDFSVETDGEFKQLDKNAVRYFGGFSVSERKTSVSLSNLEQNGFPFFAGKITLKKTVNAEDTNRKISFAPKGINCLGLKVNGHDLGTLLFSPYEFDLSKVLKVGENEIELTLTNTLRNLLGLHHTIEGESYGVGPGNFFKSRCVWTWRWDNDFEEGSTVSKKWDDNYCLVETSADIIK